MTWAIIFRFLLWQEAVGDEALAEFGTRDLRGFEIQLQTLYLAGATPEEAYGKSLAKNRKSEMQ